MDSEQANAFILWLNLHSAVTGYYYDLHQAQVFIWKSADEGADARVNPLITNNKQAKVEVWGSRGSTAAYRKVKSYSDNHLQRILIIWGDHKHCKRRLQIQISLWKEQ